MSSCPSDHDLLALLGERLDAADESRIVAHVESCDRCQHELAELTRGDEPNPSWLDLPDPEEPPWVAPDPWAGGQEPEPADGDAPGLRPSALPGPSEDGAGDLGGHGIGDAAAGDGGHLDDQSVPTVADFERPSGPAETVVASREPARDPGATVGILPSIADATGIFDSTRGGVTTSAGAGADGDGYEAVTEDDSLGSSPLESPVRSAAPTIPGYEVLDMLGQGGMGVVYKARQLGLNRLVALKMIIGGNQARPDLLARFRVEAEAVARLRHPNILQIYDIGEVDGSPFVSLELLEGGDLDDRLADTPQPGPVAAELMATLARAVQAAHEARIVHRDLKPANVLFTAAGVPHDQRLRPGQAAGIG